MKKLYKKVSKNNHKFLKWPLFVLYYFILRGIFGLDYLVIYPFAVSLIIFGIPFEISSLIFFLISLITYSFGATVEANHYMSFVYGFLGLSLIKYFYIIIKERYSL